MIEGKQKDKLLRKVDGAVRDERPQTHQGDVVKRGAMTTQQREVTGEPEPGHPGPFQSASLLEIGNASATEADRRRTEARAGRERCKQAEEDVRFSSQHAYNVGIHWQEQRPATRAQQVLVAGVVTEKMRKEWDDQDEKNSGIMDRAKFSILQVKRVQRWRAKIERWPATFSMGCPVEAQEGKGKNPGLGAEVLCRVACLRCGQYHHSQCCCRKGWSPRTRRVKERLEESYELNKIEKGDEQLRKEIREDKERQVRTEQQRKGPYPTATPTTTTSTASTQFGPGVMTTAELFRGCSKANPTPVWGGASNTRPEEADYEEPSGHATAASSSTGPPPRERTRLALTARSIGRSWDREEREHDPHTTREPEMMTPRARRRRSRAACWPRVSTTSGTWRTHHAGRTASGEGKAGGLAVAAHDKKEERED